MKPFYNQTTGPRYTKDEMLKIALNCSSRKKFRSDGYLDTSKRLGIDEECLDIVDNNIANKKLTLQENLIKSIEDNIRKCSSISHFRSNYPKLYYQIKIQKMDQYLNFHIKQKFSTQQLICKTILESLFNMKCLYNTRSILDDGKELDIYFESHKIACEYNSFYWHAKRGEADSAKSLICEKQGIYLITVEESSLNYHVSNIETTIEDIKNQLKSHIPHINKITGLSIDGCMIDSVDIDKQVLFSLSYSHNDIEYIIKNCNRYSEIKTKYNKIWQYLSRNKMLHVLDPVKSRDYIYMDESKFIQYVISSFPTYTEFSKHKIYQLARKRKYIDKIKDCYTNLDLLVS